MDPGLLLCWSAYTAPVVDEHSVVLPGAFVPTVLPMAWVSPAERLRLWQDRPTVPLRALIAATLALGPGAEERIDRVIERRLGAQPLPTEILAALDPLVRRRAHALGLRPEASVAGLGADGRPLASPPTAVLAASDELRLLLGLGEQRLWAGPLLVRYGAEAPPIARRVVPEISLAQSGDGPAERRAAARALAALHLALAAPPAGGWPPWLQRGLAALAAERATGAVPSLAAAAARRAELGPAGLESLLAATDPAEADCLALTVLLLHSRQRTRFAPLLDALRGGLGSVQAIAIAYGRDPAALARP